MIADNSAMASSDHAALRTSCDFCLMFFIMFLSKMDERGIEPLSSVLFYLHDSHAFTIGARLPAPSTTESSAGLRLFARCRRSFVLASIIRRTAQIGRASCRERV